MGNQPSAPAPPPPPPAPPAPPPPPPLPPPCDLECQKQKDLALLKTALDTAAENQDGDPAGYERARIAYYTLLNGQGWLATEKQRIAKEEVEPVVKSYSTNYATLKDEQKSQAVFVNLANNLKAQEAGDKEDNAFLQTQLNKEKDKAEVLNRLSSFNVPTSPEYSYIPIIIDILIAILMMSVLYFGFTKFNKISSLFTSTPSIDGSIT
jgi:hypothetical protein